MKKPAMGDFPGCNPGRPGTETGHNRHLLTTVFTAQKRINIIYIELNCRRMETVISRCASTLELRGIQVMLVQQLV
ncbi:MAG: hypothetical protein ABF290_14555, partial [Thiogranum sp.]